MAFRWITVSRQQTVIGVLDSVPHDRDADTVGHEVMIAFEPVMEFGAAADNTGVPEHAGQRWEWPTKLVEQISLGGLSGVWLA